VQTLAGKIQKQKIIIYRDPQIKSKCTYSKTCSGISSSLCSRRDKTPVFEAFSSFLKYYINNIMTGKITFENAVI